VSGIVFVGTADRDGVCAFYRGRLGFETWLEQSGCTVLRYDDRLVWFCDRAAETGGVVTLVSEERAAVDGMHEALSDVARVAD
jgi:hypothetical protein